MAPHLKHARSNDTLDESASNSTTLVTSSNTSTTADSSSSSSVIPVRRRPRILASAGGYPKPIKAYIPHNLRDCVLPYHGDFCLSPVYHPQMIAQLMAEGFLPIATDGFLLPKLHKERCVIPLPQALHVSKSVRKKAKRYRMTFNECFQQVVQGCHNQHGNHCWLYPPLVAAFATIQSQQPDGLRTHISGTTKTCPVRLFSVEVWDVNTNQLVAGELGYTVGSIFTSLTGFSNQNSAGSVQLAALGRVLCQAGFTLWDLGMDMEYKRSLGSELMQRDEFVHSVHSVRMEHAHCTLPALKTPGRNCRELIDSGGVVAVPVTAAAAADSTTTTTTATALTDRRERPAP